MDSLLVAATPALELAALLVDPEPLSQAREPANIRELAEAALTKLAQASIDDRREPDANASRHDALLALAALLDELALRDEGALAERWRHGALLQQRFLHPDLTTAGDRFFERLGELLLAPRDAATLSTLRIYAICLELGFQGRFAAHDEDRALAELRARLRLRLGALAEPQSATPRRSLPAIRQPRRSAARRLLPGFIALCIVTTGLSLGLAARRLQAAVEHTSDHIEEHRRDLLEVAR